MRWQIKNLARICQTETVPDVLAQTTVAAHTGKGCLKINNVRIVCPDILDECSKKDKIISSKFWLILIEHCNHL